MSKRLRWDGTSYGRNDFDTRAGYEWENGPDPRDIGDFTPDIPWNLYKPGNKVLWDNTRWAVTSFGLEPLYSSMSEKFERFMIPTDSLLQMHNSRSVYYWPMIIAGQEGLDLEGFEEAFRKAIEIHRCKADEKILEVSLRRARGLRRRNDILRILKPGIVAPHRTTRGFIIPYGWHR